MGAKKDKIVYLKCCECDEAQIVTDKWLSNDKEPIFCKCPRTEYLNLITGDCRFKKIKK